MTQPADRFLCKLTDNWCDFKFQGFSIRDEDSKLVLVNVPPSDDQQLSDDDKPEERVVKYHLGPQFLHLRNVGLKLNFSIGGKEVKGMKMIEKHFFKNEGVIREYMFDFPFVMPDSTNEWDFVYAMP